MKLHEDDPVKHEDSEVTHLGKIHKQQKPLQVLSLMLQQVIDTCIN